MSKFIGNGKCACCGGEVELYTEIEGGDVVCYGESTAPVRIAELEAEVEKYKAALAPFQNANKRQYAELVRLQDLRTLDQVSLEHLSEQKAKIETQGLSGQVIYRGLDRIGIVHKDWEWVDSDLALSLEERRIAELEAELAALREDAEVDLKLATLLGSLKPGNTLSIGYTRPGYDDFLPDGYWAQLLEVNTDGDDVPEWRNDMECYATGADTWRDALVAAGLIDNEEKQNA